MPTVSATWETEARRMAGAQEFEASLGSLLLPSEVPGASAFLKFLPS